jgi:hypothetical protein
LKFEISALEEIENGWCRFFPRNGDGELDQGVFVVATVASA